MLAKQSLRNHRSPLTTRKPRLQDGDVYKRQDMDRIDYLRRDSFYTGVTEGNIG